MREDQSDLASWTRGDRKARFEQAAERHAGLNQFAAPFLSRMKFVDEQGEGASPTLAALRAYREHRAAGRRGLPPDVSIDFAPPALQRLIRHNGETDRRRWKSALFLKVHDEIQTAMFGVNYSGRSTTIILAGPASRIQDDDACARTAAGEIDAGRGCCDDAGVRLGKVAGIEEGALDADEQRIEPLGPGTRLAKYASEYGNVATR